jgi:hypothetical protein
MYQFVTSSVMLIISFASLSAVVYHAVIKRTIIYWRLLLAAIITNSLSILQLVYLSHQRKGHKYDFFEWGQNLQEIVLNNLWPFTVMPTLLYTS